MPISTQARRAALALATALACLTQTPVARAEDKPLVRFNQYPGTTGTLLAEVAARKGFCAKHGIRCESVPLQSGVLALQTLLAKSIDVAMIPTEIGLGAIAKGSELRIVGGGYGDLAYVLLGRPDIGLPGREQGYVAIARALKGKRIGVFARGAAAEAQFNAYLADAGLKPQDVTYVAVGSPATAYPTLAVAKQVDAVFNVQPMDAMCKASRACNVLVDPSIDAVPRAIGAMKGASNPYFVRADFLVQHPAVVDAFLRANTDAQAWMREPANFDALLELATPLIPLTGVPQADNVRREWLKSALRGYSVQLDRKAVDAINQFGAQAGLIAKPVDTARVIYSRAP